MPLNALAFALAALAEPPPPARHAPWLVEGREPVCTMGAVFSGDRRVIIEYHPRTDQYHLLLAGRPWRNVRSGQQFSITLRSGTRHHSAIGQAVVQEGAQPAVYLPLTVSLPFQGLKTGDMPNDFIEDTLFSRRQVAVEVDGKAWTNLPLGQSRQALRSVAKCSDRFTPNGRSMATIRLRKRNWSF